MKRIALTLVALCLFAATSEASTFGRVAVRGRVVRCPRQADVAESACPAFVGGRSA